MSEIRVLDVNRRTLELFGAPDKPALLRSLPRRVPRRHGDAFPRAADRSVGRQAVPAARSGELRARRHQAEPAAAILGAARPRARLVAGAGRAHRHHRAQEGRSLSRISRHPRRADQALQPLLLCRRTEPAGAQGPASGHHHHGRSQRPEGRQRRTRPRRRRRSCCGAPARC